MELRLEPTWPGSEVTRITTNRTALPPLQPCYTLCCFTLNWTQLSTTSVVGPWSSNLRDNTGVLRGVVKSGHMALAAVAQWTECRCFGSRYGHMPGLRARSLVGGTWEEDTHWCFFPSLSPSLPLSLKIKKENLKKKKWSYELKILGVK